MDLADHADLLGPEVLGDLVDPEVLAGLVDLEVRYYQLVLVVPEDPGPEGLVGHADQADRRLLVVQHHLEVHGLLVGLQTLAVQAGLVYLAGQQVQVDRTALVVLADQLEILLLDLVDLEGLVGQEARQVRYFLAVRYHLEGQLNR